MRNFLKIKNSTKKGYLEAYEGDSVNLAYPNSKTRRGRVGKQLSQTLQCNSNMGVVVKNRKIILKRGYAIEVKKEQENIDGIDIIGNYSKSNYLATAIVNKKGLAPTVRENHGQVTGIVEGSIMNDLRIRKLTPKECWRLMGFDDEDVDKASQVNSNTQLYKQAGNSIVVNVLEAIFKQMNLPKNIRVLELFAGIGACSKALERMNLEPIIVDAVEIDKYAIKSFNAIHNTNFEVQDVTTWNKDIKVDLITHGSPCQDFSLAGKQAGVGSGNIPKVIEIFEFPPKEELKLKLKDMLEDNVDEKYYLSEKAIKGRQNTNYEQYKLDEKIINNKEIHPTILARFDGAPTLYTESDNT